LKSALKGIQIGTNEQFDIEAQVDKVLRGLGNPEPPFLWMKCVNFFAWTGNIIA